LDEIVQRPPRLFVDRGRVRDGAEDGAMREPDARHRQEGQLELAQRVVAGAVEEDARGLVLLLLNRAGGCRQRLFLRGEVEVEARARDAGAVGDALERETDDAGAVVKGADEPRAQRALAAAALDLALSPFWSHPTLP